MVSIDINYDESEGISLGSYNTKDSPMYLLTSFPVRLMFPLPFSENKYKQKWIEHGLSNGGFDLKAVSEIASINENIEVPTRISKPVNLWHIPRKYSCIRVDTNFEISSHYTGTKYKNKSVWWCYGIGPVKIEVDFDGVESCEGELVGCKIKNTTSFWPLDEGNEWIYLWRLCRPNNSKNISDPTKEVTTKYI